MSYSGHTHGADAYMQENTHAHKKVLKGCEDTMRDVIHEKVGPTTL